MSRIDTANFEVGDLAEHVSGELDPRRVLSVDGDYITLDILGKESPPFPRQNYTVLEEAKEAQK